MSTNQDIPEKTILEEGEYVYCKRKNKFIYNFMYAGQFVLVDKRLEVEKFISDSIGHVAIQRNGNILIVNEKRKMFQNVIYNCKEVKRMFSGFLKNLLIGNELINPNNRKSFVHYKENFEQVPDEVKVATGYPDLIDFLWCKARGVVRHRLSEKKLYKIISIAITAYSNLRVIVVGKSEIECLNICRYFEKNNIACQYGCNVVDVCKDPNCRVRVTCRARMNGVGMFDANMLLATSVKTLASNLPGVGETMVTDGYKQKNYFMLDFCGKMFGFKHDKENLTAEAAHQVHGLFSTDYTCVYLKNRVAIVPRVLRVYSNFRKAVSKQREQQKCNTKEAILYNSIKLAKFIQNNPISELRNFLNVEEELTWINPTVVVLTDDFQSALNLQKQLEWPISYSGFQNDMNNCYTIRRSKDNYKSDKQIQKYIISLPGGLKYIDSVQILIRADMGKSILDLYPQQLSVSKLMNCPVPMLVIDWQTNRDAFTRIFLRKRWLQYQRYGWIKLTKRSKRNSNKRKI